MLTKIRSATTVALEGEEIKVEVDVASRGFPTFSIVGLPNKAIDESKERVRTAIRNSQFDMPESKIVVNLAPADIPKEGSLFDLPVAVGILASSKALDRGFVRESMFVGELSLDGSIRSVDGVLPIAILARKKGVKKLYVPSKNAQEAAVVAEVEIYPVTSLSKLVLHLNGMEAILPLPTTDLHSLQKEVVYEFDFADIKGQKTARRALEIAAAGFHNVHMKGPPGGGKTLLARTFPSILPEMDESEIIDVSRIYSVSGLHDSSSFVLTRPFRAPHHTISRVGLIGGGSKLTPGEISLAHRGVLFLDEFPEFPRTVLEALRQPLEDGIVSISRASGSATFPARFQLVTASNPCPCGYLGHPKKACKCTMRQILNYKKRVSGPMLDRIDLHIDVPAVSHSELVSEELVEDSGAIRKRVAAARGKQAIRFREVNIRSNGEMSSTLVKKFCTLSPEVVELLKQAVSQLSLSARAYFKILKVARTIADLDDTPEITTSGVSEALHFRVKEDI